MDGRPLPQGTRPADHRGEIGLAQRLLVECSLCGYHVSILAEFFGKTVHCPECAGNTVFTESTLSPVKDELLDRLALDTQERRALRRPGEPATESALELLPEVKTLRSFLIGVALGLLVLGLWMLLR